MASKQGYCSLPCLERATKNPYETKKLVFPDENLSPSVYKREDGTESAFISEETAREIKKHLKYGMSVNEIAGKFGVRRGTVEAVKYGKTWRRLE